METALTLLFCIGFISGPPIVESADTTPPATDLLFMSNREGNAEIYLLRGADGEITNLTHHDSSDNWPEWSPDGSRILFQSKRSGNLDIWVMNSNGSDPQQLTTDPEPDYLPSWSPDGKSICFTSWRKSETDPERAPHIYIMNADGTNQRRLIQQSLGTSSGAVWSPDGKWITYSRRIGEGADVFVSNPDGQNERRVTFDGEKGIYNGASSFSPDGQSIAFYSDTGTIASLEVIGGDGTGRRTVLSQGQNWYPQWSPDGAWIVFSAAVEGTNQENIDIFAIRLSGDEEPVLLVGGPAREQEGRWKPREPSCSSRL